MPIDTLPDSDLFRSRASTGLDRVDRKNNIVFGANLLQAGDLNDDRPWTVDADSLSETLALMQRSNNGTKARYTHPNMSSDGMGTYLGRWKNPRIDGDKLRADLHIADTAFKTPKGDLATYVMDLAEDDPDMFGLSIAPRLDSKRMESTGDELRKENADARDPIRLTSLRAIDVVDQAAATRGGFFSVTGSDKRDLPAQATALLDTHFSGAAPDVVAARINGFLATYFQSKGLAMPETQTHPTPPVEPVVKPEETLAAIPDLAKVTADATAAERTRITKIQELCKQAGQPDLAAKYCESDKSVTDVQGDLFAIICEKNQPVGDGGGTAGDTGKDDPNAKYKAEFAAEPSYANSMTEEEYCAMRRVDDGLEPLESPMLYK